ncbi:MAG: CDP-diacylglycerol--serine O-phosphatidyltransferase [Ruminococcaceae bacterium]|nr:CDP-diacylglycerol--serine O-phosphatidyltransferase [Oscillospiraceae bacterium]
MLGFYNYTVVLTYLSFISGVTGIVLSLAGGDGFAGVICLMLSGFFDLFDGKVASTKKNRTPEEKKFGIQIDSLSDLVCFGVLPGAIGYALGLKEVYWIVLFALYALAALIRLAYFNVAEEARQQTTTGVRKSYNGMPVTSVAIFIPVIYFIGYLCSFPTAFPYIYAVCLGIFAIAMLLARLNVPKIGGKNIYIWSGIFILAIAIAAVVFLLLK